MESSRSCLILFLQLESTSFSGPSSPIPDKEFNGGIDYHKESIPTGSLKVLKFGLSSHPLVLEFVTKLWGLGTEQVRVVVLARQSPYLQIFYGDQVSILSLAGRYETLFVALARQATQAGEIDSSESIPGLHKRLQIRAQATQPGGNGSCMDRFLGSLKV